MRLFRHLILSIKQQILNPRCSNEYGVLSQALLPATSLLWLLFLLPLFLPAISFAQNFDELDLLIFEPVALDPDSKEEINHPANPYDSLSNISDPQALAEFPTQEFTREEIDKNLTQYREQVTALESASGPFSPNLFQTLVDLGTQHQLLGEHETAIEIFERAEYISRINEGLNNPRQFPSIEKAIESHLAMGDVATANQKQNYLLFLSEDYYGNGSLETLPSLLTLAGRNMKSFSDTFIRPVQPTFSISSSASGSFGGRRRQQSPREMAFGSLFFAQQNYNRAISTLLSNKEYFNPLLLDLEYKYLETLFLQTFRSSILEDPHYYLSETRRSTGSLLNRSSSRRLSFGYAEGNIVFERLLIYLSNNPESHATHLAKTIMEYGDWNILFNHGYRARQKYTQAWQLMADAGMKKSVMDELFRPTIPVHMPGFTAKPNSREKFDIPADKELNYEGHVDIAFTISKYGRAKRFEILDTEGNITRQMENRLRRYLRNSPFRPRLNDEGKSVADRVTLRYYVAYADPLS